MKFTKKLNLTLLLVVVCLIMTIWVSYAWFTMALNPEVQRIETNVGANGSLEIALLTEETFADPTLIKTTVGDSAVKQDLVESNKSWGNVIQLGNTRYGLEHITLLPARLNVSRSKDGTLGVGDNLLKIAEFGIDGRIRILDSETASTTWSIDWNRGDFTYYVAGQRYGVRAIGTISNISAQQIALASARTLVPSYTTSAVRTVQSTWQTYGDGVIDILYRHYALGQDEYTDADVVAVQGFAAGIQEATEYVLDAMHQLTIGLGAMYFADEPMFEAFRDRVNDPENYGDVSLFVPYNDSSMPLFSELHNALLIAEASLENADEAVGYSRSLSYRCNWEKIEDVLSYLMRPGKTYLGEKLLSDAEAFAGITGDNVILVPPEAGILGQIAYHTGNYNAFTMWRGNISMEMQTASEEVGYLVEMQAALEAGKAAGGNWTRTNMDDLYGFALDLAFRCNEPSDLQLQSSSQMRVEDDSEFPVTQGSGSYMMFRSDNMEYDQLIRLMDTIRVGFLNDRGELLGVAKMNLSNSYENEYGEIRAPLNLYEYTLAESGAIEVTQRSKNDVIRDLPQNTPVIVTVVVWLDGDHVDNSMVSDVAQQSMSGILNLQFSSSADLVPSKQMIERD